MTLPYNSDNGAGANGPAAASSADGTLPLVGDLGTIYQAPAPPQSNSGGSSGSSPGSTPSGNSSGFAINVSYDQNVSSLPTGFVAAINYVVSYYESIFTAPITVNIDVGYGEIDGQQLQSDALGESETFLGDYSYSSIANALAGVDPSAAASLPSSMPVNGTMWVGTAEAKALGLSLEQPSTDIDGYAGFSDVFPFTYNPNNRAVSGDYDFIGVVEHEFTEVMGRIDLFGDSIGGTTGYSLLDMFHYTAPGQHTYTGQTTNYFSANGGTANLDYFNSNPDGDLGDWAGSAGTDSYLAFTPTDEEDTVSQSDITEMNALGYRISGQSGSGNSTPPVPGNTTADMIMERGSDGTYEIYDIGGNAILAASAPGQISTQWQVAGLGGFNGTDTSDMILRNGGGVFEIYDVANNTFTGNATAGQVGLEWSVSGFGDFSSRAGETDMVMRNSNTGAFEVYDISNNAITFATGMGQVGLEWTVSGFGDFSGRAGETGDMLIRNSNTGQFEVYDISNNQITFASGMGQVGFEWTIAGFGDFSGHANETDMLMRNSNTGAFELFDIANNQITFAGPMGQVGLEWQVAGFGPMGGAGTGDMLMRNSNTGTFEVFDIVDNQITAAASMGQVGSEWSVAGIAAVSASSSSSADAQLAQTMASFAPPVGAGNAGTVLGQPETPPAGASPITAPDQSHPAG
ncbi:MAG: NF038122 family metalloprotease [Xanthobacteraceae bacterium]